MLVFDMDVSEHSGYKDYVWAVELNRMGLKFIGLWPDSDEEVQSIFASDLRIGIIFFIVTFLSIVPLLCSLVRVWGDMILMIDNLQVVLPLLMVSLKLVVMRWKRTALSCIVKTMAEDWMESKMDVEREVMVRQARIARIIVICGYVMMAITFVVLIILPSFGLPFRHITNLTNSDRLLPLQAYYFYNTNKSPQFEITLVIQAVTMFFGAITYTSVDAFFGLTIFHLCGQLENFRRRLVNLFSYKDLNGALQNYVGIHLRLLRFADNVEDTYTLLMLGVVLYFGIVFCLFGFLLVTVFSKDDEIDNMSLPRICFVIIGIVVLLTHMFLYCYIGEFVTGQCEAVYHVICNLEWYKLESRNGRAIIMLLIRTNEPFHITAGKIMPLTLATFCNLLKTSAGYISFLLAKRG